MKQSHIVTGVAGIGLFVVVLVAILPRAQRHFEIQKAEKLISREEPMLTQIDHSVPFTTQAPHGNWEMPYQEACEEAAVLMVIRWAFRNPIEHANDANAAILDLLRANEEILGYEVDQTAEQVQDLIREIDPDIPVELVWNPSIEQLKEHLHQDRVIIVPAAGQELKNPFFHQPGPLYHMLVIRGYTEDGYFITNDPGTKRGERYLYPFDVLMNAIGDWNDGDPANGQKVVLAVSRPKGVE